MATQPILLNYQFNMVRSKSQVSGHLSVPTNNDNEGEIINKLIALALFADTSNCFEIKYGLNGIANLDGFVIVNRFQRNMKPILVVTSPMSHFAFKKLHHKYHLVQVSSFKLENNDLAFDCDSYKVPTLSICTEDTGTISLDLTKKIQLDCYLEGRSLSVVINKGTYLTFNVSNLGCFENNLRESLFANAG